MLIEGTQQLYTNLPRFMMLQCGGEIVLDSQPPFFIHFFATAQCGTCQVHDVSLWCLHFCFWLLEMSGGYPHLLFLVFHDKNYTYFVAS